jgi:hypothetical protein
MQNGQVHNLALTSTEQYGFNTFIMFSKKKKKKGKHKKSHRCADATSDWKVAGNGTVGIFLPRRIAARDGNNHACGFKA